MWECELERIALPILRVRVPSSTLLPTRVPFRVQRQSSLVDERCTDYAPQPGVGALGAALAFAWLESIDAHAQTHAFGAVGARRTKVDGPKAAPTSLEQEVELRG